MLDVIGAKSLDELLDQTVPASIRARDDARPPGGPLRDRRCSPRCATSPSRNRAAHEPDRHGLHGHHHAAGDPAQRPGEPGLVHRLHAVPGRDQPGPARGAAQLPDDGRRADRAAGRQRLAARRGDGGRRGDGDGPAADEGRFQPLRRPPRHPPADDRRAGDAGRAGRHRARRRRRRGDRHRRRLLRRAVQPAHVDGRRRRLVGGHRARPRRRRPGRRRHRPPGLRADDPARPARRRHRRRLGPALRGADGLRRTARRVHRRPRSTPRAPCPDASSASAPTPPGARRCAWRCRPASSTSAGRRRRPTSARPRSCWPTSPGFYAAWHGPDGSAPDRRAHPPLRLDRRRRGCSPRATGCATTRGSTRSRSTDVDADAVLAAARSPWHRPASRRRPHASASRSTRRRRLDVVERALAAFGAHLPRPAGRVRPTACPTRPATDELLPQAVFHRYHTEHEMLRYLRRLADRDLALDRTMIPLGSCTMKLNATTEMAPITWPEFADLHPFAPDDDSVGLRPLIAELEAWLAEITGYDAVSVQPNAGSQGEFAGLLAIRAYHRANGDDAAHGLPDPVQRPRHERRQRGDGRARGRRRRHRRRGQRRRRRPAGQARAGRRPGGRDHGHLPVDARRVRGGDRRDLRRRARRRRAGLRRRRQPQRARRRGPSRAGSAPTSATSTCTRRSASPTAAAARASDRSPCVPTSPRSCPATPLGGPDSVVGPVSAAPYGSAGILPIPWAYIALMGPDGLAQATAVAICSANYVATRLGRHYPVLYRGANGRVGHECIVDLRGDHQGDRRHRRRRRQAADGLRLPRPDDELPGRRHADDRADRERDAGRARPLLRRDDRHPRRDRAGRRRRRGRSSAARCAWRRTPPRSCSASGTVPTTASSAPTRCRRCGSAKYFPPVSRIDAAGGDRNLVCSCEPLEAYATSLTSVHAAWIAHG